MMGNISLMEFQIQSYEGGMTEGVPDLIRRSCISLSC